MTYATDAVSANLVINQLGDHLDAGASGSFTDATSGANVSWTTDTSGNVAISVDVPGLSANANYDLSMYLTSEWANGGNGADEYRTRGGGVGNWLVAIARNMGEAAGRLAQKMVNLADQLQGLTGKDDAQKFNAVAAELQGYSQMFNIMSQTESTVVKGLGEGMATAVRKS